MKPLELFFQVGFTDSNMAIEKEEKEMVKSKKEVLINGNFEELFNLASKIVFSFRHATLLELVNFRNLLHFA